jgi:stearoyl-CoA desaturase (Delta-9 desaturase)
MRKDFTFIVLIHIIFFINIKNLKNINKKSIIFQSVILLFALFGITGGYHRLFTHKSYEASPILRKTLLIFGSSSLEGSVKDWCSDHRLHHINDGKNIELNPYAIEKGFLHAHFGWLYNLNKHKKEYLNEKNKIIKLMEQNEWKSELKLINHQHKYYPLYGLSFAIILPILFEINIFKNSFKYAITITLLKVILAWHFTWMINSLAHTLGDKPFDEEASSCNNHICSFFTLGEGYHNYHHRFPKDYKASKDLKCIQVTGLILYILAKFKLVKNRKYIPKEKIYNKGKVEYSILK